MPDKQVHNDKLNIALEALRQTELQLEDTNSLATSADQRAMALAGTLAGVATLVGTLAIQTPSPAFALISSGGFVVCSFLAASSCMPRSFYIRGHRWRDWKGHIDEGDSYFAAISSQAEENDERIDKNFSSLKRAANSTSRAFSFSFWVFCFFVYSQIGVLVS